MADERVDDRVWSSLITAHDFPPTAATVETDIGADTRRGTGRTVNTDSYMVVRLDRRFDTILASFSEPVVPRAYREHGYALVVADGLGESATAQAASRIAIASLAHLGLYFGRWNLRIDEAIAREIMQRMARFYRYIDGTLVHTGRTEAQSSLTAAVSAGDQLFIAHVGHSRAYLLRQGVLVQVTRDHTLEARRRLEPTLVHADTATVDGAHTVMSVLGGRGHGPEIDLERVALSDGDVVLVCTNGLSDALDETQIAGILSCAVPAEAARALVDAAFERGAADDVTATVARYRFANQSGA